MTRPEIRRSIAQRPVLRGLEALGCAVHRSPETARGGLAAEPENLRIGLVGALLPTLVFSEFRIPHPERTAEAGPA